MGEATVALYRRYRPQSFEEVVGQERVVALLQHTIREGVLPHALLFCGPRGVGKTTMARLVARAVGAREEDTIELDAASHRGIDEVRSLREEVHVQPFASPRKVYIIDEVHMLTREAFNALLKVLEEPPSHVVFILATTEEGRVPETVRSRCLVVRFSSPSPSTIATLLQRVAQQEGIQIQPEAAQHLAVLADGSFRDALTLLQQAIATAHHERLTMISKELAESITGAPQYVQAIEWLAALAQGNASRALAIIHAWREEGKEPHAAITAVVEVMRGVLYSRVAPALLERGLWEGREGLRREVRALAQQFPRALTSRTLARLLRAQEDAFHLPDPLLALELVAMEAAEHQQGGKG